MPIVGVALLAMTLIVSGLMIIQIIWFMYRYLKGLELGHTPMEKVADGHLRETWVATFLLLIPVLNLAILFFVATLWILSKIYDFCMYVSNTCKHIREKNMRMKHGHNDS